MSSQENSRSSDGPSVLSAVVKKRRLDEDLWADFEDCVNRSGVEVVLCKVCKQVIMV